MGSAPAVLETYPHHVHRASIKSIRKDSSYIKLRLFDLGPGVDSGLRGAIATNAVTLCLRLH